MIEVKGRYNIAKVFTENVEQGALNQIKELCDQEFVSDSQIRIMPDVHAGMGCVIGTTMTIRDKVVPNLVGVDIGCGMYTVTLGKIEVDYQKLDQIINREIPAGFQIRKVKHPYAKEIDLNKLRCAGFVDLKRAILSIGTLGGGNHFIEVNQGSDESLYLVIHSGSRNIGKQVADYYQRLAYKKLKGKVNLPRALSYLEGKDFEDYLHDIEIIQRYALLNRKAMADTILAGLGIEAKSAFSTIHNYIDTRSKILRKGAISAQKGEKVLIPINMRDGSILAEGKGDPDWNFSAPHGAGRIMSRTEAKSRLNLADFKDTMAGIYTTSVGRSTLDEAPMAYKPIEDILRDITDCVDVIDIIKPTYNFKAR